MRGHNYRSLYMHELSIALRAVETIVEDLADHSGSVLSVQIRVGALSGVVPDSLRFAWDVACADTRLSGSVLEIEEVPVRIWCEACQCEHTLPDADFVFRCPRCAASVTEVMAGRELEILSVEMTEHESPQAH